MGQASPCDSQTARPNRVARRALVWILGAVLLLFYLLDFYFDVRVRDAVSWMDPQEYYNFAVEVATGERPYNTFHLPSLFPFAMIPAMKLLGNSISAALWTNMGFLLLLIISVWLLRRELNITTTGPIVCAAVVASPLLLGLSRELYSEFALTAVVSFQFLLWFRTRDFERGGYSVFFAVVFGLGLMTKMTYPLFLAGPFVVEGLFLLRQRRRRRLVVLLVSFAAPVCIVALIQFFVFGQSLRYYSSLGNTRIPIMSLIGPRDVLSVESATYYFGEVWHSLLFLVAPFLVLPLVGLRRWLRRLDRRDLILAAWCLTPMLILILQPVKEPRHVAPCVVPAVLLIFRGFELIQRRGLRAALTVLLLACCASQYLAVTHHVVDTPYFLDAPIAYDPLLVRMADADPYWPRYGVLGGEHAGVCWLHSTDIAITGFRPNEALALTWAYHPAVVYNLDLFGPDGTLPNAREHVRFEDLFLLAAFNTYNDRCGWHEYVPTLDRRQVLSHADYLLVKGLSQQEAGKRFSGHHLIASFTTSGGTILVMATRQRTEESYRSVYAKQFVRRHRPSLNLIERNTVNLALYLDAMLRIDTDDPDAVLRRIPEGFTPDVPTRRIYWISTYRQLCKIARQAYEEHRYDRAAHEKRSS